MEKKISLHISDRIRAIITKEILQKKGKEPLLQRHNLYHIPEQTGKYLKYLCEEIARQLVMCLGNGLIVPL